MSWLTRLLFLLSVLSLYLNGFSYEKKVVTTPMLDSNVAIPNSGIFRSWTGHLNDINIINVFKESPYTNISNVIYGRYDWCLLEPQKNNYDFGMIESIMQKAVRNHQRVLIGIANMTISQSSAHHECDGKQISTPSYIYEALKQGRYPFIKDELYCKGGYSPDYNSPYLYKRYKALLKAFGRWIEGYVGGTNIKRKSVIYGLETRYAGYWGEGSIGNKLYPTNYKVLDSYISLFIKYLPDIQLIAGGQETLHLPNNLGADLNKYDKRQIAAMHHVYHLFNLKNCYGRLGLFIDSWASNSNQYDDVSKRVLLDDENHIIPLYEYLKENVYGKVYMTGEFDYFVNNNNANYLPYILLPQQFENRHVSGITLSNMHVHNPGVYATRRQEIFNNTKMVMAYTGYRVVLDSISINDGKLSFVLTNIGISRIFHDFYKIHIIIRDRHENVIYDRPSDFDLRTLDYCKERPLNYSVKNGKVFKIDLPIKEGSIYVIIKDKYDIEYPMTLSNYGRQRDGSYYLGELK